MRMRKKNLTDSRELREVEQEQRVGLLSNNMEARTDHEETKRFNLIYGITTAIGSLLVVLVITWASHYRGGFSWSSEPKLQFNWHPVLMVISLIFLYSQSILIYRSKRHVLKKKLKLLHTFINISAFVLAVIGLQAVFDSHNLAKPPIPNLYTLHSWVGILTVILFAYQFVGGFIAFLYPGLKNDIRAKIMPIHRTVGTATFTLAMISATSGFLEKAIWAVKQYEDLPAEGWMINFMGIILVSLGLLTLYLVNEPSYKRVSLVEDEMVLAENLDEGSSVFPKN